MSYAESSHRVFRDREDAGIQLASRLAPFLSHIEPRDLIVLGLARGGVPVAFEIARCFGGALDVCTIRKIGAPGQPELAIGAIGPGRTRSLDLLLIRDLGLSRAMIQRLSSRAADDRARIEAELREGRPPALLKGKVVIIADDGLATGASMRAALAAVVKQEPLRVIIAVPVAPPEILKEFRAGGVTTVAIIEPVNFRAVSHWYQDFASVRIATVRELLARSRSISATGRP